ncbi:hypothetical protein B0H10DRAFT_1673962, partial [Mycena sp. CBHHK59/15]
LPILQDDSANWIHYSECILTYAKSKGLGRHIAGTARNPTDITQDNVGDWYLLGEITPLADDELEAHEKKQDNYETKESKLGNIIYQTVSATRFTQIKDEQSASRVWSKLVELNEDRGNMVQMNTLTRLQQMHCADDGNLQKHLTEMSNFKDILTKMGAPLSDIQFSAYIHACDMIVDGGATRHFSPDLDNFTNFKEIPQVPIRAADGRSFSATGK